MKGMLTTPIKVVVPPPGSRYDVERGRLVMDPQLRDEYKPADERLAIIIILLTGCKLVKKSYLLKWQVNIFCYLPNEKFTSQNSFSQKTIYSYLKNVRFCH